ncbi:MAG: glutamine--fructose-6-phosphate transaminase (isomerizing) [Oscillospiraceae bacterium]|nr:glutamine--fructose-6-phosphate transaminase (isomerizing) [Oscillospiraceae bacterium]MBQ6698860.1 glutamine--fructose-6-phosphate transaminase (isomerizing) [Oscillospiraceae bacterium]
MCGIVGFTGSADALPVLLGGLKRLEYRGYDSAGIAVFDGDDIRVVKTRGRISELESKINELSDFSSQCGIGHTRWATHGEPTDENSHPHLSGDGRIAVVHNGIIENYAELRARLIKRGYTFRSETDTEVIAHLLDYYYSGDILAALSKVTTKLRGSYALGVLCADRPGEIIAARLDSPLIVGLGKGENFIASDIPAFLAHTRDYYTVDDGEIICLSKDSVTVYNSDLEPVEKERMTVNWSVEAAEKGGYEHFMLKEINEQPKAVRDTVSPRLENGRIALDTDIPEGLLKSLSRIHIIACGSAYHTGTVAKYVIESLAKIPVEVDLASEFRYREPIVSERDLCIVISQSGETADTLAAMREAKRRGVRTLAIINVVGSTIAREADFVLYTWAGPEIAVATTKAYSTQLVMLYMLAARLAAARGLISTDEEKMLAAEISLIPEKIDKVIGNTDTLSYLASRFHNHKDIFFLGRGVDYAAGLEGSLKLKEISYIRSEAYAAGELKHGTIALIQNDTLVVAIATQKALAEKMVSNIREVKARGACVLTIASEDTRDALSAVSDHLFTVPSCFEKFSPSLTVPAMQIFAYYIAVARGCSIDKPRNLAKSVTVE